MQIFSALFRQNMQNCNQNHIQHLRCCIIAGTISALALAPVCIGRAKAAALARVVFAVQVAAAIAIAASVAARTVPTGGAAHPDGPE